MASKKTSSKRAFSFDDMPRTRLKKAAPVSRHGAKARLRDPRFVMKALTAALVEGDAEAFKEILAAHLEVTTKESFYKKAGISRRTLFRMLGPTGNPTLSNIVRVVSAIADEAA